MTVGFKSSHILLHIWASFPFSFSSSVVPVTYSFCGGGRFFVRFMFFPAACSVLTQEDPIHGGFKRRLVVGLAVLDLGLELMILKGLFQSKSMNFCEIPVILVKQLECQWNQAC